jgi:flagellar biosynthesis protein FlhB
MDKIVYQEIIQDYFGGCMVRVVAILFGILFLLAGIFGFFPSFAPNGMLGGYFHVNPAHNLIHLITGLIALWAGFGGVHASKMFFRVFGMVYVLIALLGLYYGDQDIFGVVANNLSDVVLHFVVGTIALALGFSCSCSSCKLR